MNAILLDARTAALASLDVFITLLKAERESGQTSREVEMAFFADFHERLNSAFFWRDKDLK